jgi:hypothetical protein
MLADCFIAEYPESHPHSAALLRPTRLEREKAHHDSGLCAK